MVKPEEIDDLGAMRSARDIGEKDRRGHGISRPTEVTVVRETRAVDLLNRKRKQENKC